jgi:hypothetical protein
MSQAIYKNVEALEPLVRLVREAGQGLGDEARTIETSSMKEVLGAAAGAGVGGAASFAALYALGTVGLSAVGITTGLATAGALIGGGMVAGVFVLAAPIAGLAVVGGVLVARRNRERLVQAKEALLQEVIAKRDAVTQQLRNRVNVTEERAKYLEALNISLQAAVRDLQQDLAR